MVKEFHSYEFNKNTVSLHVVKSGFAQATPPLSWEVTSPPFARLHYMLQGEQEVVIDGKTYLMEKDHVYLLPTAHAVKTRVKSYMEQLYFHVNLFDYANFDILASCQMCEGLPRTDIAHLVELYKSMDEMDLFSLRNQISQDILAFVRQSHLSVTQENHSPIVLMAIDYIKTHLSAKLSLRDVCDHLFVSKSTLSLRFREEMHLSIGEYISGLLIEKAKMLLTDHKLSLSQIAESLGFYDQFYFSRKFKEKTGESPLSYRKNNLEFK